MRIKGKVIPARFLKRESRFSATVIAKGKKHYVHLPNSGRLKELLTPNREVFLVKAPPGRTNRKTEYSLALVRYGTGYVSINAARANKLFEEALEEGKIFEFGNFRVKAREKRVGLSRIDFVLEGKSGQTVYAEVKSVTLVVDGRALFPDAPTVRGRKHLNELIDQQKAGNQSAVVFVVQRSDAQSFSPNDREDREFGEILRQAFESGVNLLAYRCRVTPQQSYITDPVPIVL